MTVSGCASTTAGGAVGAQRTQLLLVSSAELENMAEQSYAKLKAESNSKGALNRDARQTPYCSVQGRCARLELGSSVISSNELLDLAILLD